MRKLAIFVEGYTEEVFVDRLLREVADRKHLAIARYSASGGSKPGTRRLRRLSLSGATEEVRYYVMLVDCGSDDRVKSDIVERYSELVANNYSAVIGIRDVYPDVSYTDIGRLRVGLRYRVPTNPINVCFVLGVMEIESWFLSEYTHFGRLHPSLTADLIRASLGFDPRSDDMQLRGKPSDDIDAAYRIVGLRYTKTKGEIERTVDALSFEHLYVEMGDRLPDLRILNTAIDAFLS